MYSSASIALDAVVHSYCSESSEKSTESTFGSSSIMSSLAV
jgi:hypothetical protein